MANVQQPHFSEPAVRWFEAIFLPWMRTRVRGPRTGAGLRNGTQQ